MSDQYVMDLHELHVAPPDPVLDRRDHGRKERLKSRLRRLVPMENNTFLDQASLAELTGTGYDDCKVNEASSQCSTAAVSDDGGDESPAPSQAGARTLDVLKHQVIPELESLGDFSCSQFHACVQ